MVLGIEGVAVAGISLGIILVVAAILDFTLTKGKIYGVVNIPLKALFKRSVSTTYLAIIGLVLGVIATGGIMATVGTLTSPIANLNLASFTEDQLIEIQNCPDSQPTVNWVSDNRLNSSSITSPTVLVMESRDNGVTYTSAATNTTAYGVGTKLKYLTSATNFISEVGEYEVKCGGGSIVVQAYGTDDPTMRMWDDSGNQLTDATFTQNVTGTLDGGTEYAQLKLLGLADQSTGEMIITLGNDNATAVKSLSIAGAECGSKYVPSYFSPISGAQQGSGFACKVPAIVDSGTAVYDIVIEAKAGVPVTNTTINVSTFSMQSFEDVDGSFGYGVEDSDGNTKYEDVQSFLFRVDIV